MDLADNAVRTKPRLSRHWEITRCVADQFQKAVVNGPHRLINQARHNRCRLCSSRAIIRKCQFGLPFPAQAAGPLLE